MTYTVIPSERQRGSFITYKGKKFKVKTRDVNKQFAQTMFDSLDSHHKSLNEARSRIPNGEYEIRKKNNDIKSNRVGMLYKKSWLRQHLAGMDPIKIHRNQKALKIIQKERGGTIDEAKKTYDYFYHRARLQSDANFGKGYPSDEHGRMLFEKWTGRKIIPKEFIPLE